MSDAPIRVLGGQYLLLPPGNDISLPIKMILVLVLGMASLTIFHAYQYKPAASRMLPASKAGALNLFCGRINHKA